MHDAVNHNFTPPSLQRQARGHAAMPPREFPTGLHPIEKRRPPSPLGPVEDIPGTVVFIAAYALPNFVGCQATVLVDNAPVPDTWAFVVTSEQRLQSVLETAFATGTKITFRGQKFKNNPINPFDGATWTAGAEVYSLSAVFLPGGFRSEPPPTP